MIPTGFGSDRSTKDFSVKLSNLICLLNLSNSYFTWSKTPMTRILSNLSRLAGLLAVILVLVPSIAFGQEWGAHDETPEYACGSEITYATNSRVTNQQAAVQDRKNWNECTAAYVFPSAPEIPACEAVVLASTVGKDVCDYAEFHDTQDTQLMERRANERQAAFLETTPAAQGHVTQKLRRDLVDTNRKTSWVIITPAAGAVRRDQIKPACSDGIDNDGDRKIDVDDPGCHVGDVMTGKYEPTDNDEWNLVSPDDKWGFLNDVLLREADNLCPTLVIANSESQTYSLQFNDCGCSNYDVKPETRDLEIYSDVAVAQIMRLREKKEIAKDLTFTEIRLGLQEGTSSYVVEVNEEKEVQMTPDGLSVDFIETETTMTVRFPNRCEVSEKMAHDAEYTGLDFIASASGDLGVLAIGDGEMMTTSPIGAAHLELGIEVGSPDTSFIATLGLGHTWYCSDWMNDGFDGQLRLGAATNRSGRLGLYVGGRARYSFVPAVVVSEEGTASDGFGPNAIIGTVEIGPRWSLTEAGVKHGFIAVTGTASGDIRYFDPDGDGLTVKGMGVDGGIALWAGLEF